MVKISRTLKVTSIFIILLSFLSIYGYLVYRVTEKNLSIGPFTKPFTAFVTFPQTALAVLNSSAISGVPPTYMERDPEFREVNRLDYDVYGLNSFYQKKGGIWEVRLFNFRNDSMLFSWQIPARKLDYERSDRQYQNSEPRNSILLSGRELIVSFDETNNLFRLDRESKIV